MSSITNTRIDRLTPLITPAEITELLPTDLSINEHIAECRQHIEDVIVGKDDRLIVMVGPCSIHDTEAALDYAQRLKKIQLKYRDQLCVFMRVYFEKPRTNVGWKGLINDPYLNNSFEINTGLKKARQLLLDINHLGLATATEFLDTIIPQYIADLISWAAIGARTTESQIHREMCSGLSMPVGFKNGTQGNTDIAIDAIFAATHPHHFIGVTPDGAAAIVSTKGNPASHIILRGGTQTGPNYSEEHVKKVSAALTHKKLINRVMIDCSHGNSQKDHTRQLNVIDSVCQQILAGSPIFGVMIESNIKAGNQPLSSIDALEYGKSITDSCIDLEDTEKVLEQLSNAVKQKRGMS